MVLVLREPAGVVVVEGVDWVTATTVVETGKVVVPVLAGQSVTDEAHEVMV